LQAFLLSLTVCPVPLHTVFSYERWWWWWWRRRWYYCHKTWVAVSSYL